MDCCFKPADILLPRPGTDMRKWAMVACDQYTSQPEYWLEAEREVGGAPSTLKLILPEAYLGLENAPARDIPRTMERYVRDGVLVQAVTDGFVFVERETESGVRQGLVGKIDLESYDYSSGAVSFVRATEETVAARIPPRMRIRERASLELPHIMVLCDDAALLDDCRAKRESFPVLYDTELYGGGGRLRGYAVTGRDAEGVARRLAEAQAQSRGFFLAMGDGNHSLAVAKACWEARKKTLPPEQRATDPARYALAELVELHSPALEFKPIHRLVSGAEPKALADAFRAYLAQQNISLIQGDTVCFFRGDERYNLAFAGAGDRLPVALVQPFLDEYIARHSECGIDYIHGEETLDALTRSTGGCGIMLPPIEKSSLFPGIRAGGVLPRKTFSMGQAHEKRYYMECRRIVPEYTGNPK